MEIEGGTNFYAYSVRTLWLCMYVKRVRWSIKIEQYLMGLSWCCKMYCFVSLSSLYCRVLFSSKFFVLGYCFIVFMPQVPCNTKKEPFIRFNHVYDKTGSVNLTKIVLKITSIMKTP